MGWDVDNEQAYAEAYREVIQEARTKVKEISGERSKAPDYAFRLPGGKILFFLEAKKPFVFIKEDIHPAYQLRRYGWSAKLPISIITDFEEFSIYDCTRKPLPTDKASVARIKYLTYKDYLNEFDFLWGTFSKENVLKGSFDKFVQSDTQKRGTATVDKDFLQSLDQWRTYLATSISWNNKELDEEEINFLVQQTIDRLIFLRIAEDRGVEPYGQLKNTLKQGGDLYQDLFYCFRKADEKYNSGLFDFQKDKLSVHIKVDNKVIKTILTELYYPLCPYEFSVLSVEILGSAYEQFLGKQIKVDKTHRVVIEEKPEVRKAGGVYYTPQFIVDYIVKNTVGKLVDGQVPAAIAGIKIVDPACGSGSFLIGAYQYLLEHYREYYREHTSLSKGRKNNPLTPSGQLTTAVKKKILLDHIYGVDIDANAVEVTKLSLLLKCLEGETEASVQQQLSLWNERVLPTLDDNIKCGNSLVSPEYGGDDSDAVRPFNWYMAFPEVFKIRKPGIQHALKQHAKQIETQTKEDDERTRSLIHKLGGNLEEAAGEYDELRGFDVVIGNPPYVRQELLGFQKKYFEDHYQVFHGMADLYCYFIEKGITLLHREGLFGIIVANKWMRAGYGEPLRRWLKHQNIKEIVDFGDLPVFEGATTYPCILISGKGRIEKTVQVCQVKHLQFESLNKYVKENRIRIDQASLQDSSWNLASTEEKSLLEKLQKAGIPLEDYVKGKIFRGVLTGLNEAFVIDRETRDRLIHEDHKSAEIIKPFLAGRDIKRYESPHSNKYLIFTRRGIDIQKYPAIKKHLEQFKKQLTPKPLDYSGEKWAGRKPGNYKWYEIQDAVDYYAEFEKPKIIAPAIIKAGSYCFDKMNHLSNDKTTIIPTNDLFILGVLNSRACDFYLKSIASTKQNGYFEYKPMYISKLPIPNANKEMRMSLAKLVHMVIELNKKKSSARISSAQDSIIHQIKSLEDHINHFVYQLYGLTEDEIAIVEQNC